MKSQVEEADWNWDRNKKRSPIKAGSNFGDQVILNQGFKALTSPTNS